MAPAREDKTPPTFCHHQWRNKHTLSVCNGAVYRLRINTSCVGTLVVSEYSLASTGVRSFAIIEPDFIIVLANLSGPLTMPKRSVEDRLQSLQDKRDALAAEIKDIQAQKVRQLRKRQHQREALLGKAVYQLVAEGAVISADTWSEEFILQLMDDQLTRQRDRQLFGLKPLSSIDTPSASIDEPGLPASQHQRTVATTRGAEKATTVAASRTDRKIEKQQTRTPLRQLNESSSQDELMDEFNL